VLQLVPLAQLVLQVLQVLQVLLQVSQLVLQVLPEQLALKMFVLPLEPVEFHPLVHHLLRLQMRRQMSKSLLVSMS
jgi:hypothetical protein